ncbi:MAG TPA: glycoside hydrolase family 3 C-terminal domain-containing protein [Acidiphilium sp.]
MRNAATIRVLLALLCCLAGGRAAMAAANCPWRDQRLSPARRAAMLLHKMTLDDEIDLVEGQGIHKPYVFYMEGLPKLCIPSIGLEDGPSGVGDKLAHVTALPAGVALAATWDPVLARRYGQVIGAEQKAKGVAVDLGPTVNIDRDPRWGRSFETFSEDPYLTARMAVAEIDGIQSRGVMAQVKHFAVYNQETYRNTPADDAIVPARALHEIYLPAFRAAVRNGKAASVMCGYSTVNGVDSCANRQLLTDILRQQWGFDGFVTSDYAAIHGMAAAGAGTDMEQPFSTYFGSRLKAEISGGKIPRAVLDTMARRILVQLFRFGMIDHPLQGSPTAIAASAADRRVATEVAEAGTILLKNRNHALPLDAARGGSIVVIGPAASLTPVYAGGGSAYVIPSHPVTPLQGLRAQPGLARRLSYVPGLPTRKALTLIPDTALSRPFHAIGKNGVYQATLTAPETGTYVLGLSNPCHCYAAATLSLDGQVLIANPGTPPRATYLASVRLSGGMHYRIEVAGAASRLIWATPSTLGPFIARAAEAARHAAVAIVVVADPTESEAADRPRLDLPSAQNALITAVAAANPDTVVVIDAGAPVLMPWLGKVAAVVDAWYPGETNGEALAAVLFGTVDPGGHLPVTFPRSLAQVPAESPARFPGIGGKVDYSEGLDVGYRWYSARHIRPLFPFGFGLSYTDFAFGDLKVESGPGNGTAPIVVSGRITNTGHIKGTDVAQLYLEFPKSAGEPPLKLVGFQRVTLTPGQSRRLSFTIAPRQIWWWHDTGWTASPGTYRLYLGDAASRDRLPQSVSFRMPQTVGARRAEIIAPPNAVAGRPFKVQASLSAGGEATLTHVRLKLDAPPGWIVTPGEVAPSRSLLPGTFGRATFIVTPPSWSAAGNYTLRAVADLGRKMCTAVRPQQVCTAASRSKGATIRVQRP